MYAGSLLSKEDETLYRPPMNLDQMESVQSLEIETSDAELLLNDRRVDEDDQVSGGEVEHIEKESTSIKCKRNCKCCQWNDEMNKEGRHQIDLSSLHEEILVHICRYLTPASILRLSLTSPHFYHITGKNSPFDVLKPFITIIVVV
jgi:hypothetical protein